jgi:hypothetical protein
MQRCGNRAPATTGTTARKTSGLGQSLTSLKDRELVLNADCDARFAICPG